MNIFISADIEGTCGITDWKETDHGTRADYAPFQLQMTREVAAACEGASEGGATDFFIRDAHDSARNIDPAAMPKNARIMRGWAGDLLSMVSGLDAGGFDAVFFTGYHAWAASPGNPLSHTMNTGNEYVLLNGVRMSEFMLNAYTAGYYGVPVALLTGDRALCESAPSIVPGITTVAVNEGIGGAVISMHPQAACEAIRDAAQKAVSKLDACKVSMPNRFETVIRYQQHKAAYSKHFYPGARLEDGKNVCFESDDWYEMLRFYHFTLSI